MGFNNPNDTVFRPASRQQSEYKLRAMDRFVFGRIHTLSACMHPLLRPHRAGVFQESITVRRARNLSKLLLLTHSVGKKKKKMIQKGHLLCVFAHSMSLVSHKRTLL